MTVALRTQSNATQIKAPHHSNSLEKVKMEERKNIMLNA